MARSLAPISGHRRALPANRIGIDTGAYATGRLTALVLEGTERRFIAAVADELGQVRIEHA